jgi:hypothetical protein
MCWLKSQGGCWVVELVGVTTVGERFEAETSAVAVDCGGKTEGEMAGTDEAQVIFGQDTGRAGDGVGEQADRSVDTRNNSILVAVQPLGKWPIFLRG